MAHSELTNLLERLSMKTFLSRLLIALACCWLLDAASATADWPQYRGDASRSGYTATEAPASPQLAWWWTSLHPPQPAWPRSDRLGYDRAFHPVVVDGAVFFGSSADGSVHAMDAATGKSRWTFATDAPVRFAPAVWQQLLLVASDDGHLYALHRDTGELVWKRRGGPSDAMTLGNERLISKWPARGGPLVLDDTVYFAAGIWPSEGIYVYALDPATGQVRWLNDDSGGLEMPQPHGGAVSKSGVSAQGYLVASGNRLLVPTGRAVPAALDRATGKFQYFRLQQYGHSGGAPIMAVGDMFFNAGESYRAETGEHLSKVGGGELAATPTGIVKAFGNTLTAYRWEEKTVPDRKGMPVKTKALTQVWSVSPERAAAAVLVAGSQVIVGQENGAAGFSLATGKPLWEVDVQGVAHGLAVAAGRLVVSTDRGAVYSFGADRPEMGQLATRHVPPRLRSEDEKDGSQVDRPFALAAKQILAESGVAAGYCVDLDCGTGELALELARQSDLRVYAVTDDAAQAAQAREKLHEFGERVAVHVRPLGATGYPNYFADLVVSERALTQKLSSAALAEARRVQRPYGGKLVLGPVDALKISTRGPLAGAGNWTHQYGSAANELCSQDERVNGDLTMLWFRDIDLDLPQRHGRGPAPLLDQGILYHEGIDELVAVDAYNGRLLWRYKIPGVLKAYDGDELMGAAGTGSNYCVADGSVFVRHERECLRLDAKTGKLLQRYAAPDGPDGKPGIWGYIACEQGILYGSIANPEHVVTYRYRATTGDLSKLLTESSGLFAIDVKRGDLRWQYQAEHSIRHNAVAIAGDKVLLIDRPLAMFDRVKRPDSKEHAGGKLVALSRGTGKVLWEKEENIYGTALAASVKHDVVVMSYQPTRFQLDSERNTGMAGFRLGTGERIWDVAETYLSRPLINDYTIYTQTGAWDLLNGAKKPFKMSRSYGCGVMTASASTMLFRSGTLGYLKLDEETTTENYGGIRPGCWINAIPAGGLVLMPDATAGCRCSYLNKCWFALESPSAATQKASP